MIDLKDIKIDCFRCNFTEGYSVKECEMTIEDLIMLTQNLYEELKKLKEQSKKENEDE